MFCKFCGQPIVDNSGNVCPKCSDNIELSSNSQQSGNNNQYTSPPPYNPYNSQPQMPYGQPYIDYSHADIWMKILSFFFPIVGIILYCADRNRKPNSAKDCLKISLIAIGVQFLLYIIAFLIGFSFFSTTHYDSYTEYVMALFNILRI